MRASKLSESKYPGIESRDFCWSSEASKSWAGAAVHATPCSVANSTAFKRSDRSPPPSTNAYITCSSNGLDSSLSRGQVRLALIMARPAAEGSEKLPSLGSTALSGTSESSALRLVLACTGRRPSSAISNAFTRFCASSSPEQAAKIVSSRKGGKGAAGLAVD